MIEYLLTVTKGNNIEMNNVAYKYYWNDNNSRAYCREYDYTAISKLSLDIWIVYEYS